MRATGRFPAEVHHPTTARRPRRAQLLTMAMVAMALTAPAAASAATLVPGRACYLTGSSMQFTGSGFAPGAPVQVSGPGTTVLSGQIGANGNFSATLNAPLASYVGLTEVGSVSYQVTARDTASATQATAQVRLTVLAFKTSGGVVSPRKLRTWSFSGFIARPGKPIYGHFRFGGRTRADYRFGVPQGACGALTRRAPGIPVRRLRSGRWTVQIDQNRTYRPKEPFSVRQTTTVFRVAR